MNKHHNHTWRIGIDFGETIGRIDEDDPLPFAFEMTRHLVGKFGAQNMFIVSKAGVEMERKTRHWLTTSHFYSRTKFVKEQVVFVREYHEKANLVQSLGINVFLDDSVKVVRSLSAISTVDRIFWMHAKPSDIRLVPKDNRHRIAIVQGWPRTMKYFQKIHRKHKT
mmetsp:Transcript_21649/g.35194  ORF Transcript_21649/g.35194 Transcript_21649/m.35194 type:complete len:166 (-) Transcript_21649:526-1023(-)